VTRRFGWWFLKEGEVLNGVVKGQGLRKGEKIERLGKIKVVSLRGEPLKLITADDVVREGFPRMTPAEFIRMFCKTMGCDPETMVNRIEFEYVGGSDD